jgi:phosphomannomutase
MGIFKAYDVRGVVPAELDEGKASRIGRAAVAVLKAKSMVVGRDWRPSGEKLAEALCAGIRDAGADALDIGRTTTPMLYFAVGKYGYDAACMVTASHNPPEYNGFKFTGRGASPVSYDGGLNRIEELIGGELPPKAAKRGGQSSRQVREDYLKFLAPWMDGVAPLSAVVDAMHGSTGAFLKDLFARLPVKAAFIRDRVEDAPPGHEANPLKSKFIEPLCREVVARKADMGVAFDGDGDRVMFVDEKGRAVGSDLMTGLMAPEFLKKYPGSAIGYDLRSSRAVAEEIQKAGGKPFRTRVGHSFIKAVMREKDSPFAGELSGHFYFRDHFFTESADIAMLTVMRVLSRNKLTLSAAIKPLARYHQSGEINFTVDNADAAIERLSAAFKDGKQDRLDGLTVDYDKWWFNVRKSNTEPILRLNLEAGTEEMMKEQLGRVERVIKGK